MRKHIQSWLVTFAVIFASSMGFHACSDDDVIALFANLGALDSQLGDSGDVTVMASAASMTCSEQCDGEIPDMYEFSVDGTLGFEGSQGVIIGIDGETFSVVAEGEDIPAASAESMLIAMINDAETGSELASASAGSVILTPFNMLNVPEAGIEGQNGFVAYTTVNQDVLDTLALTDAITSLFDDEYGAQGLVMEAIDQEIIDAASSETREVALSGHQDGTCDTGTARLDESVVVEINDMEIVTEVFFESQVLTFVNCAITGDWLDNGGGDETVTLNGSITATDLKTETQEISTTVGTIWVDAVDSESMPFWVDRINANTREVWDLMLVGLGPDEVSGGLCYGGNVVLDGDNMTDTGDTCTNDGTFVSATDFYLYTEPGD